eukprot:GHVP01029936.1.p1 GENE.GHVP01029936.1~~GHVP01029936.1.p1  ORF type:complete len:256 (+),score=59.01 GHVP01029936.1:26-769(+)
MAGGLNRKLNVLECPENLESLNFDKFQRIVLWLENSKIRLLTPSERRQLKAFEDKSAWTSFLIKYLDEMQVKNFPELAHRGLELLESSNGLQLAILNILAEQAIIDEYMDAEEESKIVQATEEKKKETKEENIVPELLCKELNQVLVEFSLPPIHPPDANWSKILSILMAIRVRENYDTNKIFEKSELLVLSQLPSGIGADNDEKMKNVATIARLIHVESLRKLQSSINRLIVEMQEISADPKTNSA